MNNKCPCCGAEMTPDGAFPLADQGGATLGGASAPAYNCTRCKKIILDYSVRHLSP